MAKKFTPQRHKKRLGEKPKKIKLRKADKKNVVHLLSLDDQEKGYKDKENSLFAELHIILDAYAPYTVQVAETPKISVMAYHYREISKAATKLAQAIKDAIFQTDPTKSPAIDKFYSLYFRTTSLTPSDLNGRAWDIIVKYRSPEVEDRHFGAESILCDLQDIRAFEAVRKATDKLISEKYSLDIFGIGRLLNGEAFRYGFDTLIPGFNSSRRPSGFAFRYGFDTLIFRHFSLVIMSGFAFRYGFDTLQLTDQGYLCPSGFAFRYGFDTLAVKQL